MSNGDLQARTRADALRVIRLVQALPRDRVAEVIGKQLLRSATSVGANYRTARRAKSPADFIAKIGLVEEEADECPYWLDLLSESGLVARVDLDDLITEGNELVAITVASIRTAKSRQQRP